MPSTKCFAATGQVSKVEGGYLFSESALRDTVAGWTADKESVEILRAGMDELKAEFDSANETMRDQLDQLQSELSAERKEAKRELKRAKFNYFLFGAILGAAVGAIVTSK